MSIYTGLKKVLKKIGLGRTILKLRHLSSQRPHRLYKQNRAKRLYLADILNAKPLPSFNEAVEVHMLLQSKRLLEGMWTFYSLARFLSNKCKFVVHDDGSLREAHINLLKTIFPNCLVISRAEADEVANTYFASKGLVKCKALRDTLIFGLKLFDVVLFAKTQRVLLLDSDVLTYTVCKEIIQVLETPENACNALYMQDVSELYCLDRSKLRELLKRECIVAFNPGIALVPVDAIDFLRLEAYLQEPEFWNAHGEAVYFAELTLWAMELSLANAQPFPKTYALGPTAPGIVGMVCCHYCGGIDYTYLFYTDGIPTLRNIFKAEGIFN